MQLSWPPEQGGSHIFKFQFDYVEFLELFDITLEGNINGSKLPGVLYPGGVNLAAGKSISPEGVGEGEGCHHDSTRE